MGKRHYTIRLYKFHDRDLFTFATDYHFNLTKAVYCALSAFTKGEVFVMKLPEKNGNAVTVTKKVYSRILSLDEEKDAEAVKLLDMIKSGYRNNFLKSLLRLYLCYPLSYSSLNDPTDIGVFENMFETFKADRRLADAGSYSKNGTGRQKKRRSKGAAVETGTKEGKTETVSLKNEGRIEPEKTPDEPADPVKEDIRTVCDEIPEQKTETVSVTTTDNRNDINSDTDKGNKDDEISGLFDLINKEDKDNELLNLFNSLM